jgi:hypothetical protein
VSRAPASRAESKLKVTKAVGSARESSAKVPDGLDWERFRAAYFPGSRRHNLKAIVAYGAYRRLRAVEPSSEDVEATNGLTGSTALQGWEDEGGATL